ncbi:translation initiation factor IF-3 [bacterium]|nr:MAG: translation initiation factor IF-3 [bacterium]
MALRPRGNRGRPEPRRDITPINERIRFPQVRVISESNEQLGVMQTREAVNVARERGYDLILVAPNAQPPVCRIMDYGKFKYEQSKKKKAPKSAANELKMVRLHPRTGPHDRDILVRHAERFLREGHKVRVVCQFKGRENAYPELGRAQMDAISGALAEISAVEGPINKQGRDMTMMIAPKAGLKPLPKSTKDTGKNWAKIDAAQQAEDAKFAAEQALLAEEADETAEGEEGVSDVEASDVDELVDESVEEIEGDTETVEVGEADVDAAGETDDLSDEDGEKTAATTV